MLVFWCFRTLFVSYSSFHVIVGVRLPNPKSLHSPRFEMSRISSSSSRQYWLAVTLPVVSAHRWPYPSRSHLCDLANPHLYHLRRLLAPLGAFANASVHSPVFVGHM